MGLDMYLSAEKYISGYDHNTSDERLRFNDVLKASGLAGQQMPGTPSMTINLTVGYWRKANAIHNWFVTNVQDGNDECQDSHVSREQLEELLSLCRDVLETRDATRLPPSDGFFFGGIEIDDGYWADIRNTIEILSRVLTVDKLNDMVDGLGGCDFKYHASW